MTHPNLPILFCWPSSGWKESQCYVSASQHQTCPWFFVTKSQTWQNHTKWYFWMSQNLSTLNFNAICLLQSLHKKTSDRAHRVLKHFEGWLKQTWLCILRSSFSKIVCSQCLRDQSINNSSTIDVTCFATIYQFKMIPSKWCVSKLLADQSFINHQQSFINYQHDTSNRSSLGWNRSPAQRPGRYLLRMMRP